MSMKTILKLEELAQFALGIFIFSTLPYAWWVFLALFLLPDIGMLGYVVNAKLGAFTYNAFHHKGIAIAIGLLGVYLKVDWMVLTGVILFSHAAFDRVLGYGLKFEDSFKNTHLGSIGK